MEFCDQHRSVVSFVRRSPRMNASQHRAWEQYHSRFVIEVDRLDTDTSVAPNQQIDWASEFGRDANLIVEIGSGTGLSLVPMAKSRPEANIVAFEVYQPAIASTLGLMGREGVTNIRLVPADAVAGLERLFHPGSISELWTFFPDPWHKKRHFKRRLVQPDFASLVASRLHPDGVWRLATDWEDYAAWIREILDAHPDFVNPHLDDGGVAPRLEDRPITRFEKRGMDAGRTITDFTYRLRSSSRTDLDVRRTTRYRMTIAYDGTGFSGWAIQPRLRTVQGTLEKWLGRFLSDFTSLTVAGRTDAGVHANAQVAHFDSADEIVPSDLLRRLRRVLPDDIVVRDLEKTEPDFDARFAATWRKYRYRIWDNDSVPDPIRRHNVARVHDHLDIDAMNEAATHLLGLHDFAAFCKRREGATTIRTVLDCHIERVDSVDRRVEVWIKADAFCHSMVRSVVGALCSVGSGRRDLAWFEGLIDVDTRQSSVFVMPALGLTLEEVGYPDPAGYAERVAAARSMRCPDPCAAPIDDADPSHITEIPQDGGAQ